MSEKQYLKLAQRIVDDGEWVYNERTGKRCKTVVNETFTYDVGAGEFPLVTTRKSYWRAAIAEMIGYLRGYHNSAQFEALGTTTWNANANENLAWLNNPHRNGEGDIGLAYGNIARHWPVTDGPNIDTIAKVVHNLSQHFDDRDETITFRNPGEFDKACLRPCLHTHQFSILNGTLHLTSYQRSVDVPLGLNFNQVQVFFLLAIMAQITGLKAGIATHHMVNCHIYEDQFDLMKVQLEREPLEPPTFHINPQIKSFKDIETWVTLGDLTVSNYNHHDPIKFPFSV